MMIILDFVSRLVKKKRKKHNLDFDLYKIQNNYNHKQNPHKHSSVICAGVYQRMIITVFMCWQTSIYIYSYNRCSYPKELTNKQIHKQQTWKKL